MKDRLESKHRGKSHFDYAVMAQIGFHASLELFKPSDSLQHMQQAYEAGFVAGSCSDHFNPWSVDGEGGFAWSWLGAALERVPFEFGTVCAPGQRYHPVIIAQAAATLAQMYPGRFWVALGTGQNVNEHVTGDVWPPKRDRQQRLLEAVDVIRRLWAGDMVTADGLVRVKDARLYSLPKKPPMIYGAAVTHETAEWVGSWADGLLTVAKPPEELAMTVAAFRRGGGQGKPMRLQSALSLGNTDTVAATSAFLHWGIACLEQSELQDIPLPEDFDRLVASHRPDEIRNKLRVSSDIDQHIDWIRSDVELGFESIYLHYVGSNIKSFIKQFSQEVLPKFH